MVFRRLVFAALLVGAISGLFLSAIQRWQVVPIIDAAERFEETRSAAAPGGHSHAEGAPPHEHATPAPEGHTHPADAWAPADGAERIGFTILSNVLTAVGFALVMLAVMSASLRRVSAGSKAAPGRLDWRHGLLWGLAGYAVFFVAPTLGLPPEIPGAEAAALESRQSWWMLTVACTGLALVGAAFGKPPWRWAFLALIAVPYLIGAPHLSGSPFAGYPPEAAAQLDELARRFVWATALANGLFWLVLGAISGWAARRFLAGALDGR